MRVCVAFSCFSTANMYTHINYYVQSFFFFFVSAGQNLPLRDISFSRNSSTHREPFGTFCLFHQDGAVPPIMRFTQ